eukprot:5218281-Ditylum_brightwellii.AAC.1
MPPLHHNHKELAALISMQEQTDDKNISPNKKVILSYFQQWCGDSSTHPKVPNNMLGLLLSSAIEMQKDLGWDNFDKGRISKY